MSRSERFSRISEEDYLKAEESASVRHEYVDGYLFAMTGATDAHNIICGNIFSLFHARLRGGPCRAYINDMKLQIKSAKSYYYPDIMVSCEPFEAHSIFKKEPLIVVEILSPSTAAIDRREKLLAYQKVETLKEYLIVSQDRKRVEIFRRRSEDQWETQIATGEEYIELETFPGEALTLSLNDIYEGYNPPGRVREPEAFYDPCVQSDELVDA